MTLTTSEIISLIALFVTIVGWLVTGLFQRAILQNQNEAQRELAELREEYDFDREKRGYLVPAKLTALDDMVNWVEEGWKIRLEAERLNQLPFAARILGVYKSRIGPLNDRLDKWVVSGPKHIDLAKNYDPQYSPAQKWEWGSEPFPDDLPSILEALQTEVISGVEEKQRGRQVPKIYGLTNRLHLAAIHAIERIREQLTSQEQ